MSYCFKGTKALWMAIVICSLFGKSSAFGSTFSSRLSYEDRIKILEILGYGSTVKILSNPEPLGGYSGVEIGLTSEPISLEETRKLGNGDSDASNFEVHNLSFGKGLYYDIDLFFNFTPVRQAHSISSYGAMMRWNFFRAPSFPASLSLMTYSGGSNFDNLLSTNSLGMDLVVAMNFDDLSFYFGGGKIRVIGSFVGGESGITDSKKTEQEDVFGSHSLFGLVLRLENYFLDVQIDRYAESLYSAKLGYRY